jgi:hypothetical protein
MTKNRKQPATSSIRPEDRRVGDRKASSSFTVSICHLPSDHCPLNTDT